MGKPGSDDNLKMTANDMTDHMKRVLVVDDEVNIRLFLKTLLETSGYEPHLATNAREGFSLAQAVRPDLILLDLMMPGEGGLVLYQRLQESEEMKDIPVIVLSAVGADTFRHAIKLIGVSTFDFPDPFAYVQKPPLVEDIARVVKAALGRE